MGQSAARSKDMRVLHHARITGLHLPERRLGRPGDAIPPGLRLPDRPQLGPPDTRRIQPRTAHRHVAGSQQGRRRLPGEAQAHAPGQSHGVHGRRLPDADHAVGAVRQTPVNEGRAKRHCGILVPAPARRRRRPEQGNPRTARDRVPREVPEAGRGIRVDTEKP